jgi:hypothetical protein
MPLPQASTLHIDQFLTDLSVGYLQDPSHFVADQVAPLVKSAKRSNKIPSFNMGDLYRDEMAVREAGAESAGGGYRVSNQLFYCDVWASHIDVDDLTVASADSPFDLYADATRVLVQRERIKREVRFAADLFTTSLYTGGTANDPAASSLSGAWDDPSSTPIEDIHDQSNSILLSTGYMPNTLVVNNLGWNALKNHPDVVDRVKYTSGDVVSESVVARLLGVERILVCRAVRNTAAEGVTTSMSAVAGNHALLAYVNPSPGMWQPSAAYTFVWTGYPGSTDGRLLRRFRIEARRAERIEIEAAFDQKLIDGEFGVLIQSVAS